MDVPREEPNSYKAGRRMDALFSRLVAMKELAAIMWLSWLMIISGVVVLASLLLGMRAMYGRYATQSSFIISARTAWFIQEFPSFAIPVYYLEGCRSFPGMMVLSAFIIHYFNRTFIYPNQIKSGNGTPWYICLSATVFCIWNGYLQGSYHGQYYDPSDFFSNFVTYIGMCMFIIGMLINIHSDSILRNLRKPGEVGYKIPQGGMFEYVSGANFFGEIVEWTGYAMMARSLPAIAFATFTACNIGPRAIHHHQWYLNKFPDYPRERKAVIPFVL